MGPGELDVGDHVAHVGVLDGDHAVVGEHCLEPTDEVVEIGHVRHDVVGDHDVGGAVLGADGAGTVTTEEAHDGGHADRLGGGRRTGRGIDAQRADTRRHDVAQQVAVIARHLDDE